MLVVTLTYRVVLLNIRLKNYDHDKLSTARKTGAGKKLDPSRESVRCMATLERTRALINAGHRVIEKWECDDIKTKEKNPKKQTKTYPHAIFYDFESLHDSTKRKEATDYLTYDNAHVPISVSIGDTLELEPTHICDPDPKELIRRFMEELKRRARNI